MRNIAASLASAALHAGAVVTMIALSGATPPADTAPIAVELVTLPLPQPAPSPVAAVPRPVDENATAAPLPLAAIVPPPPTQPVVSVAPALRRAAAAVRPSRPAPSAAPPAPAAEQPAPVAAPGPDRPAEPPATGVVDAPLAVAVLTVPAPPAARPMPSSPVAYGGNAKPAYPVLARERGLEGRVVLRVEVLANGAPGDVTVAQSSGHAMLDRAARDAVARWRFAAATVDGQPVAGAIDVPVVFRLTD